MRRAVMERLVWLGGVALGTTLCSCAQVGRGHGVAGPDSVTPSASATIAPKRVEPPTPPPMAPAQAARGTPPDGGLKRDDAGLAGPPTFPALELAGRTYGLLSKASTPEALTLLDLERGKAVISRDIEHVWPQQMLRLVNDDGSTCSVTVEGVFRLAQSDEFDDDELAEWKKQGLSDEAIALEVYKSGAAMNALRVLPSAECRGTPLVIQSMSEPVARVLTPASVPDLEARAIEFARALPEFAEIGALYRETVLDVPREAGEAPPEQNWEDAGGYSAETFASADQPQYVRVTVDSGWVCSRWHVWRGVLLQVIPNAAAGFRVVAGEVGNAMSTENSIDFLADLDGSGVLIAQLRVDHGFTFVDDRWPDTRDWSVGQKALCPC